MFRAKLRIIRGGYMVTESCNELMKKDGLTMQVSALVDKEDCFAEAGNPDLSITKHMTLYFSPTKAGWEKVYRRLRSEFKEEIGEQDEQKPLNLQARLMLYKKGKGVEPCAV